MRFAGRCRDGPFGLVVLDAETEELARELMQQDPSVLSGVQSAGFYPYSIFLAREREP